MVIILKRVVAAALLEEGGRCTVTKALLLAESFKRFPYVWFA
jgi:hypothetical protein